MLDDKNIPLPEPETIEREIRHIVAKGVVVPESFLMMLRRMYQQIGLRFLMRDTKEITIATMIMVLLMIGILATGQEKPGSDSGFYGLIMVVSPLLYGLLSILPFLNSKFNGTFEVEMACKYNLYQIASFRMLVFSVFCFFINTFWVLSLTFTFSTVQFVQALMISTASLMVFSLLFLYVLTILVTMAARVLVMMAWMGLNGVLLVLDSALYHQLLISVPWYLYGIVMAAAGFLYLKKLKEFMLVQKTRGAYGYVNS
jgi:hypothetical protein